MLGFDVDEGIASSHTEKEHKYPPRTFLDSIRGNSRNKQLHGIFIGGHGSNPKDKKIPVPLISNARDLSKANFVVTWNSIKIRLRYKLGLALLNTCFSDDPKTGRLLVSPNAIFRGSKCTLLPVEKWADWVAKLFGASTFRHFVHIIKPGEQGTKTPKGLLEMFKELLDIGSKKK